MKLKSGIVLLCGIFTAAAFGNTIYVSPAGGGDGSSAESPLMYKEGIKAARGNDVVQLADGVYQVNVGMSGNEHNCDLGEYDLVTVQGNVDHPEAVVLDAHGVGVRFLGLATGKTTTVRGITFRNQCSTDATATYSAVYGNKSILSMDHCIFWGITNAGSGAAIMLKTSGGGTIEDCKFIDCMVTTADKYGAVGRDNTAVEATIRRCTFTNCEAGNGGAIYGVGKLVADCTFEDCRGRNGGYTGGGAISSCNAGSVFTNCTFRNCSITGKSGGAMYLSADASVLDCVFTNCTASTANGGAIYASSNVGSLEVLDSTFVCCSAKTGGAIDCAQSGKTYGIYNCRFLSNAATEYPASINANAGSPVNLSVRNCLFAGNSVADVSGNGAIDIRGKMASGSSIDNCTFVGGRGTADPVAKNLYPIVLCSGSLAVTNCVFWDNRDTQGNLVAVYKSGGDKIPVVNSAYDATIATDRCTPVNCLTLSSSPFVDAEHGDFTLAKEMGGAKNPCLDSGLCLDWMTAESKDLAGNKRICGAAPDLGCYESPDGVTGLVLWVK